MKSTMSNSSFKLSGKFTLLLIALIFFLTMTTYVFNEVVQTPNDPNGSDVSIIRIVMNSLKSSEDERDKLLLINVEQQNDTQKLLSTILRAEEAKNLHDPGRKVREAVVLNSTQTLKLPQKSATNDQRENRGYYEEQRAVVVHAESAAPILGQRQPPYGPPTDQDSDERPLRADSPFYDEAGDDYSNSASEQDGYYQRGPRPYYPDSREQYAAEERSDEERQEQQQRPSVVDTTADAQAEGRSNQQQQQRQYDAYYRQWHYATTPTPQVSGNRKLQPMRVDNRNRDPYDNYEQDPSEYDYAPTAPVRPQQQQQQQQQQQHLQQQQYRPQQTRPQTSSAAASNTQKPNGAVQSPAASSEPTYLTMMKSIKTMWDIYQAFSAAWGAVTEHRQKQLDEQQKQQQLKRQQLRINSKKPPKFENVGEKIATKNNTAKASKTTTTTTKTSTTTIKTSDETDAASSTTSELPPAKNEPRKSTKAANAATRKDATSLRMKRDSSVVDEAAPSTEVAAEGRYIKGDPLKGYYDFVITEGSYKFWAVFQVGTALLIIYSTFAAIYYSKVNPLVSDYDYTDYLGGARSLSGGDLDFVDDGEEGASENSKTTTTITGKGAAPQSWSDWLPRTGHSLKFILEAIDKLPGEEHVEYEAAQEQVAEHEADGVATHA